MEENSVTTLEEAVELASVNGDQDFWCEVALAHLELPASDAAVPCTGCGGCSSCSCLS